MGQPSQVHVSGQPAQSAAIITGGGRGIGRAITLRLVRDMPVVAVGRNAGDLASVCAECLQRGGLAVACVGDVADPATAAAAVALVRSRGWAVQHLVCNAGIGTSGSTVKFDPAEWRHIFDVNVHGCFHMVQACLPDLLTRAGAAITIISSLAGVTGVSHDAAYTASKHALVGFARSLALEYRKSGLTVAALCPSFVESEMTQRTIHGVMTRRNLTEADARQRIADRCPAKRILPAEEIAEAVALIGAGQFAAAVALAGWGGYPILGGPQSEMGGCRMNTLDPRLTEIIEWIRQTTHIAEGRGVLVPVSGGSDSALCFWLCAQALPRGRVQGTYIGNDLRCADWFMQLGTVCFLPDPQQSSHKEADRWALILSKALDFHGWLVGSRNRTEDVLGTYSLASRVATYLPLVGLWKSEVMALAEAVGVPSEILLSSRRADPLCGRPKEMAEIPFEDVDRFLKVRIGERPESDLSSLPQGTLDYLDSVCRYYRFKTELPLRAPLPKS